MGIFQHKENGDKKITQGDLKGESKDWVFWLVNVAADLSSYWMKTAATASAVQGVFSNIEQITVWFGNCSICSLLYISS